MLAEWETRQTQMPEEASSAACVARGADSAAQPCRGQSQTQTLPFPSLQDPAIGLTCFTLLLLMGNKAAGLQQAMMVRSEACLLVGGWRHCGCTKAEIICLQPVVLFTACPRHDKQRLSPELANCHPHKSAKPHLGHVHHSYGRMPVISTQTSLASIDAASCAACLLIWQRTMPAYKHTTSQDYNKPAAAADALHNGPDAQNAHTAGADVPPRANSYPNLRPHVHKFEKAPAAGAGQLTRPGCAAGSAAARPAWQLPSHPSSLAVVPAHPWNDNIALSLCT